MQKSELAKQKLHLELDNERLQVCTIHCATCELPHWMLAWPEHGVAKASMHLSFIMACGSRYCWITDQSWITFIALAVQTLGHISSIALLQKTLAAVTAGQIIQQVRLACAARPGHTAVDSHESSQGILRHLLQCPALLHVCHEQQLPVKLEWRPHLSALS